MQSKDEENKPFPWNDCILKLCFLLQFMAFVLCGIAFFSPFWYIDLNREIRAGLWGRCDRDYECIWFFERGYERFLPGGCCCCFLLSVQSELDFVAEHRAELKIGFLNTMLDSLEIAVL